MEKQTTELAGANEDVKNLDEAALANVQGGVGLTQISAIRNFSAVKLVSLSKQVRLIAVHL